MRSGFVVLNHNFIQIIDSFGISNVENYDSVTEGQGPMDEPAAAGSSIPDPNSKRSHSDHLTVNAEAQQTLLPSTPLLGCGFFEKFFGESN